MAFTKHLLVIDDDRFFTRIVRQQAKASGYSVEEYNDPTKLNPARLSYFNIIILDIMMPVINGVQLLNSIRKHAPNAQVVLMTSIGQEVIGSILQLAAEIGIVVAGVLHKPFKTFEIAEILEMPGTSLTPGGSSEPAAELINYNQQVAPMIIDFQPQFLLATGRWVGCEVQLSKHSNNANIHYPTLAKPKDFNFSPATPIGLDVIKLAMANIKQVQLATGISLSLWAQISAQQLATIEFPELLLASIKREDFQQNLLILELVEPDHPAHGSQLAMNISLLRQKGIRISIKYLSREYAESCSNNPWYDEIRIGSRLIDNANRSESGMKVVRNIINRSIHLCISTTAESIANPNTYKWLCAEGCNFGQGPLIANAMNFNDLLKWQLLRQPSLKPFSELYG